MSFDKLLHFCYPKQVPWPLGDQSIQSIYHQASLTYFLSLYVSFKGAFFKKSKISFTFYGTDANFDIIGFGEVTL